MKDGYVKCGTQGDSVAIWLRVPHPSHPHPTKPHSPLLPTLSADSSSQRGLENYPLEKMIHPDRKYPSTDDWEYNKKPDLCMFTKEKKVQVNKSNCYHRKNVLYALLMYEWKSRAEPLFGLLPNSPFKIPTCHKHKSKMY